MTAARVIGGLVVLVLAYLALWPVEVAPIAWTPDPVRELPAAATPTVNLLPTPGHHAPEDVAILPDGSVVAGTEDGSLLRWRTTTSGPEVWAETGGRPLGLDVAPDGRLIVADAVRGLLSVAPDGTVTLVADTCGGTPMTFPDDVAVSADGIAWVSHATDRFDFAHWKDDILESAPNGRLCAVDLATGDSREVVGDLCFANGVALGPDDSFVLVAETGRYRVHRHWLTGPQAGTTEVFLEGLPSFVDGVSFDGETFWIALVSPRNPIVDATAGWPALRRVLARLPSFLQPAPEHTTRFVGVTPDGTVTTHQHLPDPAPFGMVTNVQRGGDRLWLGTLHDDAIAWTPVP